MVPEGRGVFARMTVTENLQMGAFLRNGLNPIVHRHQCGVIILHHTNKPTSGAEKPKWNGSEFAYLGSGSAEWANWPRAVLGLRSIGGHDIFELHAGKRGSRLKWEDEEGQRSYIKVIGHSTSRQFWREVPQSELDAAREKPDAEARFGRHKPTMVVGPVPQDPTRTRLHLSHCPRVPTSLVGAPQAIH